MGGVRAPPVLSKPSKSMIAKPPGLVFGAPAALQTPKTYDFKAPGARETARSNFDQRFPGQAVSEAAYLLSVLWN